MILFGVSCFSINAGNIKEKPLLQGREGAWHSQRSTAGKGICKVSQYSGRIAAENPV